MVRKRQAINGLKLRKYRKELGISAEQIAKELTETLGCHVSGNTIYRWEKGTAPYKAKRQEIRKYIKGLEKRALSAPVRPRKLRSQKVKPGPTIAKKVSPGAIKTFAGGVGKIKTPCMKSVISVLVPRERRLTCKIIKKGLFGTKVIEYYT